MCRITYCRWACRDALHHPPQKRTFVTETTLVQAGCWSRQESSAWLPPPEFRKWGRQKTTLRLILLEPCSIFCAWPSPSRAHRRQGNLYPQLPLGSFSLAEVTPADLTPCLHLACFQLPRGNQASRASQRFTARQTLCFTGVLKTGLHRRV